MGQKVNPIGLRLILNKKWQSRWYAGKKEFGLFLQEDLKIRAYLEKKLKNCAVAKIQIERPAKKAQVTICLLYTSPSPRDTAISRMPSSA